MPDPLPLLLLVAAFLALGAAGVALRAVLDGRPAGVPASIAVLAPLVEAARAVRTRPAVPPRGAAARLGAAGLLAAAAARLLVLPLDGRPVLDTPLGIGALVVLDLVGWVCWWAIARPPRLLRRALAIELPAVLAIAAPAVAAGDLRTGAIAAAQRDLPLAAQLPAALLVLVALTALLVPWSAPGGTPARLVGVDRLLVGAARAAALVAGLATASSLLLGGRGGIAVLVATAVLLVVAEVAAHRLPVLRGGAASAAALLVLLPIALLQLGVAVALAVLGGGD